MIPKPLLTSILALWTRSKHRTLCLLHRAISLSQRQVVPLVGSDDLMDCLWTVRSVHVKCTAGIDVVGCSLCSTPRGAGGMPSNWTVRIAPCTVTPYPLLHQGCWTCSAPCRRRTLGLWIALSGLMPSLPQAPSHVRSSVRYLCLAGTFHEAHGITE